ncbi:MAG: ABC transporter permease [Planctomycetota bacterium]
MSGRAARHVGQALRSLAHHPLRTLLAAVTSAAAVAVVANVISLSQGFDRDIRDDVAQFGARTVDLVRAPVLGLRPGRERFGRTYVEAVREDLGSLALAIVPRAHRVRDVALPVGAGARVLGGVTVVEAPTGLAATVDVELVAGRWWREDEVAPRDQARVAVVDEAIARELLAGLHGDREVQEPGDLVGRELRVGAADDAPTVEVIGVLRDPMRYRALFEEMDAGRSTRLLGSSLLAFRCVYLPADPEREDLDLTGISVVARSPTDVPAVAERLEQVIATVHDPATRPALGVIVRRLWMEALGGATQAGAFVGNLVWMLVALVAAVLLATMNLVTVRERFDELAIRRVEGARRRDVATQVTFESMGTALVGGLLGLPLGALAARVLARIVEFPFRFDMRYAGVAVAVAVGIGALAALLPAWRAASIDPARVLARRLR